MTPLAPLPKDLYFARDAAASVPKPDSSPAARKLFSECQKFEALLIGNLWSEMEQGLSFGSAGLGAGSDAGASTMQGFGIQSAAVGLAQAGGVGLARMLYRQLAPALNPPAPEPSSKSGRGVA